MYTMNKYSVIVTWSLHNGLRQHANRQLLLTSEAKWPPNLNTANIKMVLENKNLTRRVEDLPVRLWTLLLSTFSRQSVQFVSWPFESPTRSHVTFELTYDDSTPEKFCKRLTSGKHSAGWGCPKFIAGHVTNSQSRCRKAVMWQYVKSLNAHLAVQ